MMENTDLVLKTLETQLSQRIEKLWRVFSWCCSILISITAAIVAATTLKDFHLTIAGRVVASVIIISITAYSWKWIWENLRIVENIRNEMGRIIDENLKYSEFKKLISEKDLKFGYPDVIILLGAVAFAASWLDIFLKLTVKQ